jgi:hypothetical protein
MSVERETGMCPRTIRSLLCILLIGAKAGRGVRIDRDDLVVHDPGLAQMMGH